MKRDADARRAARRAALGRGRFGEWLAAWMLRLKGYRIAGRNFRCRQGEIDIVATKGNLVCFVEVKTRRGEGGFDAVTANARRRIRAAGAAWIARQPASARLSWRFDVVEIVAGRWPRHHPDAF
jgi:putative endonuclease